MSTFSHEFARLLREERTQRGLSQGALAERIAELLGTKLNASAVSRIENPESGRVIKLDEAAAAAAALGVPLTALLSDAGARAARIAELRRKIDEQRDREASAWHEIQQAQATILDLEQQIESLESPPM